MKLFDSITSITTEPITLVDIGSRLGVHERWKKIMDIYPLNVIGFEPDIEECDRLNKSAGPSEKFLPYAIASKKDKRTFYITKSRGNNSLLKPDKEYIDRFVPRDSYNIEKALEVKVEPLDSVMHENNIKDVDLVKVDTEGGEMEIINGAEETIKSVFAVELEIWFNRVYEGAPLFSDIDIRMRELGFTLFDVRRDNFVKRINGKNLGGPKGQLWSGDFLYFRDLPYLVAHEDIFWNKDKIIKGIIIAMSYGYYDFALEIIEDSKSHDTFSKAGITLIKNFIITNGKRIPSFKGRYRLSKFLERLARRISIQESDFLGNW